MERTTHAQGRALLHAYPLRSTPPGLQAPAHTRGELSRPWGENKIKKTELVRLGEQNYRALILLSRGINVCNGDKRLPRDVCTFNKVVFFFPQGIRRSPIKHFLLSTDYVYVTSMSGISANNFTALRVLPESSRSQEFTQTCFNNFVGQCNI